MVSTELLTPILKIAMISLRMGALWIFFPIFSQATISVRIRMMGMLVLSTAIYNRVQGTLPNWSLELLPSNADLLAFTARELFIGAGMGLVAKWVYSAVVAAGHWVSAQMGFGVAGMFDPETQVSESAWADFHQWLGVMVFFSIGGHYFFIQALADSYAFDMSHTFETLLDANRSAQLWSEVGSRFFLWMLKLSAPMAVVLLMLQMAMGVLSKFVPQINLWSVSLPLTLGVGVLVFTFFSPMYGDALHALLKSNNEVPYLWIKFLGAR